ncbi:hypothetical protein TNCV_3227291 [Trichonephila clavipes]|nr:hypothetical protein TNCV_3227291 [Trichonephila clavipes]
MSLTYRCAISGTKVVRLSKEMVFLTITSCCEPVCYAIVRAVSQRGLGCLQTCLRLSSGLCWKWDSSLKTIRSQSVQFHVDRDWHHCSRTGQ